LILDQTILRNMTLACLPRVSGRFITNEDAEAAAGERAASDMRIKANSVFTVAGTLSGGNQQKVVLAKWLLTNPRVLFLDEPTRGIDVGAKAEIQRLITSLAEEGMSVLFISAELEEVVRLSHRIVVMRDRHKVAEVVNHGTTVNEVMALIAEGSRPIDDEEALS
jgi:ABC-type sugar transport system ATPase subunit